MDGNLNPIGLQSNGNSTSTSLNATSNQGYIYIRCTLIIQITTQFRFVLGFASKKMCLNRDCQKKDGGIKLETTGVEFIMAFLADQGSQICAKVLFTNHCRSQNFRPSLLRLVNNCVESTYKTQKTRTKVLPSATVGE